MGTDKIELAVMYATGNNAVLYPWRLYFGIIDLEDSDRDNPSRLSTTLYPEAERVRITSGHGFQPLGIARVEEGNDIKYVFFSMEIGNPAG